MNKIKKTGLFFGSFNPIHVGHLIIASYMVESTDLEEVWFVISPQNPLKNKSTLLQDYHRLAMVRIAVEDEKRLKVSDIEFHLSRPSYTVTTLTALQEKYPNKAFCPIMGSDNLLTFHKWKNYKEILKYHQLYVYPRPNYPVENMSNPIPYKLTDAPLMEISSSMIRKMIAAGKDVRFLLTEKVYAYVKEMHFYETSKSK